MNRQSIDVTIFGSTYTLSAESDEERQHIKSIANLVDTKMIELSDQLSLTSVPKIAILTALNLASEIINTNDTNNSPVEIKEDPRIDQLINKIDLCLG